MTFKPQIRIPAKYMRGGPIIGVTFLLTLVLLVSCNNKKDDSLILEIENIENTLLPPIKIKGEPIVKYNLMNRMEYYKVPGVSIAVVENGKLKWAKGYGIANTETGKKVDINTLFQAGSISKPVAALSALMLVEKGQLELDVNVNKYLKDWQIPENKFTKDEKITLRRLLSHTAGMTVHGFPGYNQTDDLPSITDVLNGKGNTAKVEVDTIPGSIWRYSGGGYTVVEKIVEDTSQLPLETYMDKFIFDPLGMNNSTYEQPLDNKNHSNISAAYDNKGKIINGFWHNYPEQAAAGLWTTATDLAKYNIAIHKIFNDKNDSVLTKATIDEMLTKNKGNWGLGLALKGEGDSLIFSHGGKNAGFTNNMLAFAKTGNAIIVMTNADNGGDLINEIFRSVSTNYTWDIIKNQSEIEIVQLSHSYLNKFVGTYKLNFQVPDIGDYTIEISIKGGNFFVTDTNTETTKILRALDETNFVDIDSGDKVEIQYKKGKPVFTFKNQFNFFKI